MTQQPRRHDHRPVRHATHGGGDGWIILERLGDMPQRGRSDIPHIFAGTHGA
jgi:hypothetical protein